MLNAPLHTAPSAQVDEKLTLTQQFHQSLHAGYVMVQGDIQ
jgi:hypothetical protein